MSTAQEIMATVGERLAANKEAASAIGAIYKFVLEGEGGGTWIMHAGHVGRQWRGAVRR